MNLSSPNTLKQHETFMLRCLDLAQKGLGKVAPNPMVGAVLVHNDNIVAEGYHQRFGGPHAEVNCINALTDKALLGQSTLYVSLEPCSHYGKTPPCANLIVESGIKKVVVCNLDPNPLVAGKGIALLESNGIEVITGVLTPLGRFLNRRFFTYQEQKRPYIILKWAQTLNGFVDALREHDYQTTKAASITSAESNRVNHKWRTEEQAIMIGKNTVLADNPSLTARLFPGQSPTRIVIGNLDYNPQLAIFDTSATTIVINTEHLKSIGNNHWVIPTGNTITPQSIAEVLFENGISSVIIEGGPMLHQQFIAANLWDEARIFTSQSTFNNGLKAAELLHGNFMQQHIGTDSLTTVFNS